MTRKKNSHRKHPKKQKREPSPAPNIPEIILDPGEQILIRHKDVATRKAFKLQPERLTLSNAYLVTAARAPLGSSESPPD